MKKMDRTKAKKKKNTKKKKKKRKKINARWTVAGRIHNL